MRRVLLFVLLLVLLLCLISSSSVGARSFPSVAVIDDFDRPDETPVVGWTDELGSWTVDVGRLASLDAFAQASYNSFTTTGDYESFITVAVLPVGGGAWAGLYAAVGVGGMDYNEVRLYSTVLRCVYSVGGVETGNDVAISWSAGDRIGLRRDGSELGCWYWPVGAAWSELSSYTLPALSDGGVWVAVTDSTARLDDFGVGDYDSGAVDLDLLLSDFSGVLGGSTGQALLVLFLALMLLSFVFRLAVRGTRRL